MGHGPSLLDVLSQLEETFSFSTNPTTLTSNIQSSPCPRYSICDFYNFLKRSHCEENLEFYCAAKLFLSGRSSSEEFLRGRSGFSNSVRGGSKLSAWEEGVYKKFIQADSPLECNFPQHIRETFDLYHEKGLLPCREDVVGAVDHVLKQLRDAYSRYLSHIRDADIFTPSIDGSYLDLTDCSNVTSDTNSEVDSSSDGKQQFDIMELSRDLANLNFDDAASFFLTTSDASSAAAATSSESLARASSSTLGNSSQPHSIDTILAEKPTNFKKDKHQHIHSILPMKRSIFNKLHGERRRGTSPIKVDIYEAPGSVLMNFQSKLRKFLRQEHARKHAGSGRPVAA